VAWGDSDANLRTRPGQSYADLGPVLYDAPSLRTSADGWTADPFYPGIEDEEAVSLAHIAPNA
jgi:hypothetical protein